MMRTRTATRSQSRRGFTVISMLVAIILLAVGLMSLARASAQTVSLQTLAQNRTNAISIARAYLEQVRTRDPWTIQSETDMKVTADGIASASGAFVRSLAVSVTKQNLLKVEVKVTYPRGQDAITLATSFFRGNGLTGK